MALSRLSRNHLVLHSNNLRLVLGERAQVILNQGNVEVRTCWSLSLIFRSKAVCLFLYVVVCVCWQGVVHYEV